MKKIIALVFVTLIILTGCKATNTDKENNKVINSNEFKSILETNGYSITNVIDQYHYKEKNAYFVNIPENLCETTYGSFIFFEFQNVNDANSFFDTKKEEIINAAKENSIEEIKNISEKNNNSYIIKVKYRKGSDIQALIMKEHTLIYIRDIDSGCEQQVFDILEKVGY